MRALQALLIDIDGTLLTGTSDPMPGAREAMAAVREADIPYLLATNTTRMPVRDIGSRLAHAGIPVPQDRILSASKAAAEWLLSQGAESALLLLPPACREDFSGVDLDAPEPDYVVVGDLGNGWTFDALQLAFRALLDGAGLVAIQKNRYWNPGGGPTLDAGPFVAALEYAAATEATLVGKPSQAFFATALARLGAEPKSSVMIGDSLVNDVAGAQAAGLRGILVRAGGGDPAQADWGEVRPDAVLETMEELPRLLEHGRLRI
jgi:phospholysine phosphohistidine inorganic pyrophosphate phosphatase